MPRITGAPDMIRYGRDFSISYSRCNRCPIPSGAVLISPCSSTHSVDMASRSITLRVRSWLLYVPSVFSVCAVKLQFVCYVLGMS